MAIGALVSTDKEQRIKFYSAGGTRFNHFVTSAISRAEAAVSSHRKHKSPTDGEGFASSQDLLASLWRQSPAVQQCVTYT
jgi:hypothetical protein